MKWRVVLVATLTLALMGTVSAQDTLLSGEEDGSLSEWEPGKYGIYDSDSAFSVTTNLVAKGSYSIDGETASSEAMKIGKDIQTPSSDAEYSFYLQQDEKANQEIQFWDDGSGNQIWGIYFRTGRGMYWSADDERNSGTELVPSEDINLDNWYLVEFKDINLQQDTLDVYFEGSRVADDIGFISSTSSYPDYLQIYENWGASSHRPLWDQISYTIENTAPSFDSVSTSPSSWTLNSDVNVSANVSDSDGTVSGVSADVWENGTQIVSDASLTENSGTWEVDNLFTVDESDVYYNYTLTATDDDGATDTYSDSQLIKNLDPKINHLKPENNSDKFSYSNDYEILIKDDGDNVPDENISCDLYSNGEEFRSVWAFENMSEEERTFTGTLNEDVGNNKFKTRCVDGDVDNTTTNYRTKYSRIEDVYSASPVYETENRTFELDLKTGDMVNNVDFTLSYDGAVEDTEGLTSTGVETLRPDLYHEVPLVDSNQTSKDWRIEYDMNISDFGNSTTSTVENKTTNQSQEVWWSYWLKNAETNPGNGNYIETEDLKHEAEIGKETQKAEITGTTKYSRTDETEEMQVTDNNTGSVTLQGVIDTGLADTFNKSTFQASSDIQVNFNGENREINTGQDNVEVYRILLTDGSTNLDTAKALEFDVDYEEENYDTKTKLTMDLSLWKNRDEKIRRYQFKEEPAQTHSYYIYPKWASYSIRTLPYPEQKKFDLIQYFNQETDKVRRSYFFPTTQTISNTTTTVPLKTINESETTPIDFEITNEDGDPAEDTYCRVDRKFGGGDFETVFQIKTGSEGKSQSFAEVNEIYYGFTCYQDGEIADEFSAQIMQNPMRLQLGGATVETSLDYNSKFDASCTSNTTTLECDYQSDTEKLEEAQLTVERNEVKQDIQVCQTSSPTSTGKLGCNGLNTTKNSYNYELLGLYPETSVQGESGFLGTQSKPIPGAGLFMTAILFMLTTAATAFDLRVGIASGTLVFILTSMINWISLNPSQQATLIGMAIIAGVAVSQ